MKKDTVLALIRASLFDQSIIITEETEDWGKIYTELKQHAIAVLPANVLQRFDIPEEVRNDWRKQIYQQVYISKTMLYEQDIILDELKSCGIPVVVLKGSSAAQYYPEPELRVMGDIDLLVKPDDFLSACSVMKAAGYKQITNIDMTGSRNTVFTKNFVTVELHHHYASAGSKEINDRFNEILYTDIISDRFILSDVQNGLVIIEHIARHMNGGIGLRQIIDWMMFVDRCLNDEVWKTSFCPMAKSIGLDTLSITVTRMCQLYLGLKSDGITWCSNADESLCETLMEYILSCGNFGNKRSLLSSAAATKITAKKNPIALFKHLQSHGENNWVLLKKHRFLKLFAWFYQLCRYLKLAKVQKLSPSKIKAMYDEGSRRRDMLNKLGINITSRADWQ